MKIDIKKNIPLLIFLAILAGALTYSIILFKGALSKHSTMSTELEKKQQQYNEFILKNVPIPSSARVSDAADNKLSVESKYYEVVEALNIEPWEVPEYTPLKYKEELRKAQMELSGKASLLNMSIPREIGFEEFSRGKIPTPDEVPLLTKQLLITEDLITMLVDSEVESIASMHRHSYELKKEGGITISILPFSFGITTTTSSLIKFLDTLQLSRKFLIVRDISIQAQGRKGSQDQEIKNILRVNLMIHVVEIQL